MDTRQEILTSIPTKLVEFPYVFLRGARGSGKSSIAKSICANLREDLTRPLAAFFFDKAQRHGDQVGSSMIVFVSTIAYQLATRDQDYRSALLESLVADHGTYSSPEAAHVGPEEFDNLLFELFIEPLVNTSNSLQRVIVLDGINDFGTHDSDSVARLLRFLSRFASPGTLDQSTRFFITSRLDQHISAASQSEGVDQALTGLSLILPLDNLIDLDAEEQSTERDIRTFATLCLDRVAGWVAIAQDSYIWRPDEESLSQFVSVCSRLFGYAGLRLRTFENEVESGGLPAEVFKSILEEDEMVAAEPPDGLGVAGKATFSLQNNLDNLEKLDIQKLRSAMAWIAENPVIRMEAMALCDTSAGRLTELAQQVCSMITVSVSVCC